MDPLVRIGILAALPVVTLALWADYAERKWKELQRERGEEPTELLDTTRLCGILAFAAQMLTWLAGILQGHALSASLIFGTAILLQAHTVSGVDRKLRGTRPNLSDRVRVGLRGTLWFFAALAVYAAVFTGVTFGSFMLVRALGWSGGAAAGLVSLGALSGLLAGLALSYALAPFYLSKFLSLRGLNPLVPRDQELGALLDRCFARAGLRAPAYWLIEMEQPSFANALITGFKSGRGVFRPALLLTPSLQRELSDIELEAVILHEVAHLKLNHLRRRLLSLLGVFMGSIVAVTVMLVACALFLPAEALVAARLVSPFLMFLLPMWLLRGQSQRQELEADRVAVAKLGASADALAEALRKLDRINGINSAHSGVSHPATEDRIRRLRETVDFESALDAAVEAEKAAMAGRERGDSGKGPGDRAA